MTTKEFKATTDFQKMQDLFIQEQGAILFGVECEVTGEKRDSFEVDGTFFSDKGDFDFSLTVWDEVADFTDFSSLMDLTVWETEED